MLWSILQRDLFTKFVWLEDEMVWNLMECRKFEVHSDCRASRAPIGAMFPWSPKGTCPSMFLLRKTAALGKNF